MERDFLGLGVKDETRGSYRNDSGFLASSVAQMSYPKNMSNLQQNMSFKTVAHEDRFKKNVYDRYSSSGFRPIHPMGSVDAAYRSSPVHLSQDFSINGQGTHLSPMPIYQSMNSNSYRNTTGHQSDHVVYGDTRILPMTSNQSIPMSQVNFFKCHDSGSIPSSSAMYPEPQPPFGGKSMVTASACRSTDTAFLPSNTTISVPATAQLTIFYGGVVNVYDNVPVEKAQAIMSFASKSSDMSSSTGNPGNQAPPLISQKVVEVDSINMNKIQQHTSVTSPCSTFSSPISVASHSAAHSGSGSSSHDDKKKQKDNQQPDMNREVEPLNTMIPALQQSTSNTLVVRAVPMARKASLARFLEKRKERITSSAPYSTQKPIEYSCWNDSPCKPASVVEKSLPESKESSWSVGSSKCTTDDAKHPNK